MTRLWPLVSRNLVKVSDEPKGARAPAGAKRSHEECGGTQEQMLNSLF